MKYSLVLTIPFLPIGFNAAKAMDKFEYNELKKSWHQIIYLYSRGKLPSTPLTKVKLTLKRFTYKSMDYDGLVSSFKAPVDGLVHAGIIQNDTWKITGKWDCDFVFLPKKSAPFITIQIDELEIEPKKNSGRVKK